MTCKEYYIEFMKREIDKLEQGKFTGNVDFKINFFNGSIANINSCLNTSVKFAENKETVKI